MTLRAAIVIGALALGNRPVEAQTLGPGANNPTVYAGLFSSDPQGGPGGGSAAQTGDRVGADLAGTVYMAPCATVGAASPDLAVSASATDVWQLSGKVLELTPEQASVQVGWRRLRREGQDEASVAQSATLTLKRGERSTLESISVPASGSCPARLVALDLVFATRNELFARRKPGTLDTAPSATKGGRVFTSSQAGVSTMTIGRAGHATPTVMNADLWLVRTVPGRPDETLHLTSPVLSMPRPFVFPAVAVQTTTGTLTVKVEGTVELGSTPEGERRFHFAANRTITFAATSRPGPTAAPIVEGSTKTTVAVPGPEEVLAFEMPPLRIPAGASLPDRLSIRVRLTSVPMQDVTRPR